MSAESGADADEDSDCDDDFPEVGLEELLDELTISPEDAELETTWGPTPQPEPAPSGPQVPQFQLPEGSADSFVFT